MLPHSIDDPATGDAPAVGLGAPVTAHRSRPSLLACVAIAALAVVPYLNSLPNDFTFDDPLVVRDNPVVRNERLGEALTAVYPLGSVYRPVTMASYVVNHRFGDSAAAYRVVNIAIHALVAVGAYLLTLVLLRSPLVATLCAALFAVHPIHTEAVNAIVGRAELLAALFAIVCLLSEAQSAQRRGWAAIRWHGIALAAFGAALLAKESALAIIPLVLLTAARAGGTSVRARAGLLIPYGLVAAAYLAARMHVVGALGWPLPPPLIDNPLAHVGTVQRVQTAAVVLVQYLSQLTLPIVLSADYSYNQIPVVAAWLEPRFLYAIAVLLGATLATVLLARRAPVLALAAWFTVVPLALTANLLLPIGTIKAERLLYLPSFGWCIAIAWLASEAIRRRPAAAGAVAALVIVAFGARTWARNADWHDDFTLFGSALATSSESAKVHYNLALAEDERGDSEAAMVHLRQALLIYPRCAEAAFAIGAIYEDKGLDAGALHWYANAMQLDWSFARAHLNTGSLRYQLGEYTAAEAAFRSGLAVDPQNPRLQLGLGLALRAQQQPVAARLMIDAIDPANIADPRLREMLEQAKLDDGVRPDWPATLARFDDTEHGQVSLPDETAGLGIPVAAGPVPARGAVRRGRHAARGVRPQVPRRHRRCQWQPSNHSRHASARDDAHESGVQ